MTFGEKLHLLRKHKGMSQEQLASKLIHCQTLKMLYKSVNYLGFQLIIY